MVEGLHVIAGFCVLLLYIFLFAVIADVLGDIALALAKARDREPSRFEVKMKEIGNWAVIEMLPYVVLAIAIQLADLLVRHDWVGAAFQSLLLVYYLWWWHRKDDDRWKKRRRKLTEKIKEAAGRLVVVPATEGNS